MDERDAADLGYPLGFAAPSDAPMFAPPANADWLEPLRPDPGQPVGYQPPQLAVPPLETITPASKEPRNPAVPFSRFAPATDTAEEAWDPRTPIPSDTWDPTGESRATGYADFAPPTGLPAVPARSDAPSFPPPMHPTSTWAPSPHATNAASIARATHPTGVVAAYPPPRGAPLAPRPGTFPAVPGTAPRPAAPLVAPGFGTPAGAVPTWNPSAPGYAVNPNYRPPDQSDKSLLQLIGWPFFAVLLFGIWFPELAMLALGVSWVMAARITVGSKQVRKLFGFVVLAGFAVWIANQAIWYGALDWDVSLPPLLFRLLCVTALIGTPIAVHTGRQQLRQQ